MKADNLRTLKILPLEILALAIPVGILFHAADKIKSDWIAIPFLIFGGLGVWVSLIAFCQYIEERIK